MTKLEWWRRPIPRPIALPIAALVLAGVWYFGDWQSLVKIASFVVVFTIVDYTQDREWIPKSFGYNILALSLGMLTATIILSYFGV